MGGFWGMIDCHTKQMTDKDPGTMAETMTSRERTETVLAGGIPDRVPVDLHNFMMTARASGMPFPEFFQDGAAMAEWQIRAWREFGHDVLLLENGTAALAEACGCQVEYMENSAPVCHGPAIRSLDELDRLIVPDPYTAHPLKENLRATRIVVQEIGDQAFILGRADQGPFSLAAMLLGMEEFLLQLARAEQARTGRRRGATRRSRPGCTGCSSSAWRRRRATPSPRLSRART